MAELPEGVTVKRHGGIYTVYIDGVDRAGYWYDADIGHYVVPTGRMYTVIESDRQRAQAACIEIAMARANKAEGGE